jgi:molybdopterin-containing oxidoreductase family membrane subunit
MLILSIAINIGMYTERFLIVATTLSRQYLPDAWGVYIPSLVEISIMVGSLAMFITLFLVFVKIFPSVSLYEVKETMPLPQENEQEQAAKDAGSEGGAE